MQNSKYSNRSIFRHNIFLKTAFLDHDKMSIIAGNILSVKSVQDKIKNCENPKNSKNKFSLSESLPENPKSELFFTLRVSSLAELSKYFLNQNFLTTGHFFLNKNRNY